MRASKKMEGSLPMIVGHLAEEALEHKIGLCRVVSAACGLLVERGADLGLHSGLESGWSSKRWRMTAQIWAACSGRKAQPGRSRIAWCTPASSACARQRASSERGSSSKNLAR